MRSTTTSAVAGAAASAERTAQTVGGMTVYNLTAAPSA
jgi:hypothetical protein